MDDLERYVDILFANYRAYPQAEKLRIGMLNELLLEKESSQMQGRTEVEAVREVLSTLDDLGSAGHNNILVYGDKYRKACAASLVMWMFVGVLLSLPMLALGTLWFSALMLVGLLFAAGRYFFVCRGLDESSVEFINQYNLRQNSQKHWLRWLIVAAVYLILVVVYRFGWLPFLPEAGSTVTLVGQAISLLQFYPPLVLLVLPLCLNERYSLLLQNEVGYVAPEKKQRRSKKQAQEPAGDFEAND